MLDVLKKRLHELAEKAKEASLLAEAEFDKVKLSEEDRDVRYDICKGCDNFFSPTTTCKKCGCFMAVKTYLPFAECPIGKWKSIPIVKAQ